MPPIIIELQPDRKLLDPYFDGYKLSLERLETKRKDLDVPVDRVHLETSQYPLLYSTLFAFHNHLIGETFDGNESLYYFDKNLKLCKIYIDPFVNDLIDPIKVWEIPNHKERLQGDYNPSLKFVNNNYAVASDGKGILYLLDTGSRSNDDTFNVLYSGEVTEPKTNFTVYNAVHNTSKNEIHVVLIHIQQDSISDRNYSVLNWITLAMSTDNSWGQIALKELKVKGAVQYAYIECTCQALYVISDSSCKFTLNSETPIIENPSTNKKSYKWSQNIETITIKFALPENFQQDLINVKTDWEMIEVSYNKEQLLKGNLFRTINADLTSWTCDNNLLEIVVTKEDVGVMWPEAVEGDEFGEYTLDTCIVDHVHEKLAHLCSENQVDTPSGTTFNSQQVEECDFDGDKYVVFERMDSSINQATHKINLGTHQVPILVDLNKNLPPAIGIRHDVDVCLWLLHPPDNNEVFKATHEGTLFAFGYVQASKQQRKFSVCPPDLSYAAICESKRHLFIYQQNKPVSPSELRNRATGRAITNIAQQQVISIPNEEIFGIYASNKHLYLLGEKFLMVITL